MAQHGRSARRGRTSAESSRLPSSTTDHEVEVLVEGGEHVGDALPASLYTGTTTTRRL